MSDPLTLSPTRNRDMGLPLATKTNDFTKRQYASVSSFVF
jgi:hypothetical protein